MLNQRSCAPRAVAVLTCLCLQAVVADPLAATPLPGHNTGENIDG